MTEYIINLTRTISDDLRKNKVLLISSGGQVLINKIYMIMLAGVGLQGNL